MLRRLLRAGVLGLAMMAMLGAGQVSAAPGGNAGASAACKDGGYLTYTDADGEAFKNVGQCVKYAAQGNTLVPVGGGPILGGPPPASDCKVRELVYANLSYCDLSDADLRYHDLSANNLSYANLSYADLSSAELDHANLGYANLTGADLSYADLNRADLTGATLTGANLDSVVWDRTFCPDGTNSDANGGTCLGHLAA